MANVSLDLILVVSLVAVFLAASLFCYALVLFFKWLIPSADSANQRLKVYEKAWKSKPEATTSLLSAEKASSFAKVLASKTGIDKLISKKQFKLENQLPDCLVMIAGALRAGYSLIQSIKLASTELAEPVSGELKRVVKEVSLGLSVDEALENMARRVNSQGFEWTVVAMNIQKEVGGNLAEVLEKVARTLRSRKEFKRHVNALTAEGRLSAIVLIILPFFEGIFLYIVNPSYVGLLFSSALGLTMIFVALVLMGIGWYWMKKVIAIKL